MIKALILSVLLLPLAALAQDKTVTIHVEQEGVMFPAKGEEIVLKKEPFKLVVTLKNVDGIYLFAGFTDSIYKLEADQKIPDFENLPGMTMAEATFNEDKELIISADGWAYWFYDKKTDWHRFDKDLRVEKDFVIGNKTVKQFYFPSTEKTMPVSEVQAPLYLFFVAMDKENKKGEPEKELLRIKIKINWR